MSEANGNEEVIIAAGELGIDPEELWQAADKLRGSIDAAEYKHVVLGLIFLKYISDAFEARRAKLAEELKADGIECKQAETLLESRDEYTAEAVFWVPPEARWSNIQNQGKQPNIAKLIDDAMYAIERDNAKLKGKLPRDYARRGIPPERLGSLIDQIASIAIGTDDARAKDILGRVYEYFLGKFAAAEGKLGGEFFTPRSVVRLLVEMIEPYEGRVYDPCCGSGGMFVQSEKFVQAHGGTQRDISIFGQESNPTTWRLAHMNLAIRGIEANLGEQAADTFVRDLHPDLKADYILANPPFNVSDWSGQLLQDDVRWKYGLPPVGNANYAWIQHIVHRLAPNGRAGFVLANGALSSNQKSELAIRKALIDNDLIDCVLYLPPQLFLTTQISASLWFLARNKAASGERDRRKRILFIYAYHLGFHVERTRKELSEEELQRISSTYHNWRHPEWSKLYADQPGFCFDASLEDVIAHRYALVPGRYVGYAKQDVAPLEEKALLSEFTALQERLLTVDQMVGEAKSFLTEFTNGNPHV